MTPATDPFDPTAGVGAPAHWAAITQGLPFRAGPGPFGASAAELRHLARDGVVVLMLGDAYAPADAVCRPGMRAAAAALVVPAGAVLAGVAAAWVHGVGGATLAGVCGDPAVDVISPPGLVPRPKSRDWLRVRQFALDDDDRLDLDGLSITSPARTAVDVARLAPPGVAAGVLLRLAGVTGLEPGDVERRLDRAGRFQGMLAVRRAVAAWRLAGSPADLTPTADLTPAAATIAAAAAQTSPLSPARLPVTR